MTDSETPDPKASVPHSVAGRDVRRRWRPRRLHFRLGIWSIVSALIVTVFLVFVSMSITGRSIALPNWVAVRVESELNALVPQGSISLRRIEIGVTKTGRPSLRLVDVGLRDASGLDIAQLNSVEGGLRLAPLFKGELAPRSAILGGAQMTFRRLADGTFALQFGQGSTTTGDLGDMLDAVDHVFTGGFLGEVDRVEAVGLTITLEDGRTGRLWQVTNGHLSIVQSGQILETTIRFEVFNQTEELAGVEVSIRTDKTNSAATLSVSFDNAAAADIGAQSPALSFLRLIDAPVSGALRTTLNTNGKMTDLAGAMEIAEGGIKPAPGAPTVKFGGAKGYVDYDPEAQAIQVSGLSLTSDLGRAEIEGKLILTDYAAGWPQAILGQLHLNNAVINDPSMFDAPVEVQEGFADLRLRFSPFDLNIGQAVLFHEGNRYELSGRIGATRDAWDLHLDAYSPALDLPELKTIWPKTLSPNSRRWVFENATDGQIRDVHVALRGPSLNGAEVLLGARLTDVVAKPVPALPVLRGAAGYLILADNRFTIRANAGRMTAPNGEQVDVTGTTFTVPDVRESPGDGVTELSLAGPLQAGLSLLNLPPFKVFDGTGFGPDVADGRFQATGNVTFPMRNELPFEAIAFDVQGKVFDVISDKIVPGSILTADALDFRAVPEELQVSGPGSLGAIALTATWRQPLRKEDAGDGGSVSGTVTLSQAVDEAFNLGLGDMVSGTAPANFTLALVPKTPPRLKVSSDMAGLALTIPGTGWSKASDSRGSLTLDMSLGDRPKVEGLTIIAPGLSASGEITVTAAGGLDRATFSSVKIGDWLDAPVSLSGRGTAPIAIYVEGGMADFRSAGVETESAAPQSSGGPSEPLSIRLDRLIIADGIVLRNFIGNFDLNGGLSGTFVARVAGGGPIEGTVAQTAKGTAYRITAGNGGKVLDGMGVFSQARGGDLEVVLAPTGTPGTFEGTMTLLNTRLVDAPAMAELLSAISVVGLIQQLGQEGIPFGEVKAKFRLSPTRVTVYSSSAVGASLGVSLDGYYDLQTSEIDMQGVLSPIYILNSLGRVVSVRDGEGLVGFSFNLSGPSEDMKVDINPLSALTPGFLREIFRRQSPAKPEGE